MELFLSSFSVQLRQRHHPIRLFLARLAAWMIVEARVRLFPALFRQGKRRPHAILRFWQTGK